MTPREELLKIQKAISNNLKSDIQAYQGRQSSSFKKYLNDYEREFRRPRYNSVTNKGKLIEKILKSDIIYVGDYHTLNQSQKTLIKILRDIVNHKRKITVCLEMVSSANQKILNDFMSSKISEIDFLQKIEYERNWGFPWKNYKPIFDFAKIHKIKILGLNCSSESEKEDILPARDMCASKIISRESIRNPQGIIFVLYGDLHICEKHLPKRVRMLLKENGQSKRYLIIFQNSEELYWKLADEGKEQTTDVVKMDSHKFCILNTPPWIKLQTYLSWLDRSGELLLAKKDTEFDEISYEPVDYYHQISDFINAISTFIGISKGGLDQFQLYTTDEVEFVEFINKYMKKKADLSLKEIEIIREEVIYNGICLLPDDNAIYISNLNINKIAEKAAQLINFKYSKSYPKLKRDGDRDFFYERIMFEMLGYIGSKIINFKRKSDRIKDFRKIFNQYKSKHLKGRLKDFRTIAGLVLKHKQFEKGAIQDYPGNLLKCCSKEIYGQNARVFLGVTKALGFILGNRIFLALMRGDISKAYIKTLFAFKPKMAGDAYKRYIEALILVKDIKDRYKSKSDRF
jgi:hypothetical protein